MQKNVPKRYFIGHIQSQHDHTGYPGTQDICPSLHDGVGIELTELTVSQIVGSDKRPLSAAKPSVKGVLVATICLTVYLNFLLLYPGIKDPVIGVIDVLKSWNRNPPRNLTTNIPVA